eukprot:6914726-Alexandrium_andersonii.AAC.1
MSASLVGSEMCIRDRIDPCVDAGPPGTDPRGGPSGSPRYALARGACGGAPPEVPRRAWRAYG